MGIAHHQSQKTKVANIIDIDTPRAKAAGILASMGAPSAAARK